MLMKDRLKTLSSRLRENRADARNAVVLRRLTEEVNRRAQPRSGERPVVFFNASTRLTRLSLNAAFQLLTAWAVRLEGVPVVHFVCESGLAPCVLGTRRDDPHAEPPCGPCMRLSQRLYAGAHIRWFQENPASELEQRLSGLDLDELTGFEKDGLPLGKIVLPSLRWILRRHHLDEDPNTFFLFRQYILSAWRVARQFADLLDEQQPQAVVVFNGMFYPEAAAKWVARQRGIRVISHEVALQPFSAFFTEGEATAYPIDLPDEYQLSEEQNARLDAYLAKRFKGNFSMAGIRFWPEMKPLGEEFWNKAGQFRQVVPVFTNVIFDTSQDHANVIFPEMFAWLDTVLELARDHPETYFVIRAHPDESRPGKQSLENVRGWVERSGAAREPNLLFVDSGEHFSSYELIQKSKFVMIYNSTIGMEAAILGAPVLSAGKARFTQVPTVFFPSSAGEYRRLAEEFLNAETVQAPLEFALNARRFLFTQLYRTSLPFGEYVQEDGVWPGFVLFKPFEIDQLRPDHSATMRVVLDGILRGGDFLIDDRLV